MEKIQHNLDYLTNIDDMRTLNYLVETVKGLRPVSGTAQELALENAEDYDY